MDLDPRICSQARLSRDPRFDGRLFIGVRSTRVYCRSICPVRKANEKNVRYFPSAAAAAEAGYRPCLRCRPELSPDTPAWSGTSTTVSRALRLISESELEGESVDRLASRLGIGSRQLRRLFVRHLGASPIAVMKTRRLHFAKKLIDETSLPMDQIAIASGFGSVRRFNAAFRKTYKRTPSQLRRREHFSSTESENEYVFRIRFRPPFHWNALLNFFAQRATPCVEAIDMSCYRRTISINGHSGTLCVGFNESDSAVQVGISFPEPRWLFLIVERVRRMFDLAADPSEISAHLTADRLLSSRIKSMPGLRLPGCWDGFELAVRAVLDQQVSVSTANIVAGKLVEVFGTAIKGDGVLTHLFPTPTSLAHADLTRIGLPEERAKTIRSLARAIRDDQICFNRVNDPEEFRSRLRATTDIEDWTVQYIAMRALGDPDAFPANDRGLLHSAALPSARELAQRAEGWRPWRAYAAMYLWQANGAV
ncbi:MAG TPA: AlkA N-terminal domain-containing protein [Pyrinomonadaceae bacterium]